MTGYKSVHSVVRGFVLVVLAFAAVGLVVSGPAAAEEVREADEGVTTTQADLEIASVSAPEEIQIDEALTVEYTLVNAGEDAGQESFVDLVVGETIEDTESDVAVPADGTVSGTLVFTDVYKRFDPGDTIQFTVELYDFGNVVGSQTDIADTDDPPDTPDLVVSSISYPDKIGETDSLDVEYTVTNVGEAEGTEQFVDLVVYGFGVVDWDENVTLGPGESTTGTLRFSDVDEEFDLGDTIGFEIALWDFADNETGETAVALVPDLRLTDVEHPGAVGVGETLDVTYTVENEGNVTGTESAVLLFVGEDPDNPIEADREENVTVQPGEATTGTLSYDSIEEAFGGQDSFGFGVVLSDFDEQMIQEVDIQNDTGGQADLQLQSVDVPGEIPPDETLSVDYTVTNVGNASGTEESVRLLVDGDQVAADQSVTVAPGGTESDALVYDNISAAYNNGDTIPFTVALDSFNHTKSGSTTVTASNNSSDEPKLQLQSVDSPEEIAPAESLSVDYSIENVGNASGTEESVRLLVDGDQVAADQSVTVAPGGTKSGTLVYDNVSAAYNDGDTIPFTVALDSFNSSTDGTTDVTASENASDSPDLQFASINAPDEVELEDLIPVTYDIENVGNATATATDVNLLVGGNVVDTEQNGEIQPNETETGTLVYESVATDFDAGETVQFTVALDSFDDSTNGSTDIVSPDEATLGLTDVDAPDGVGVQDVLTVSYTVQNTGSAAGTESEASLLVDGDMVDTDQNVQVPAGGTQTRTLVFDAVGDQYSEGETIPFTVELSTAGDNTSGTVAVEASSGGGNETTGADLRVTKLDVPDVVDPDEDLSITYTIENFGNETGTESTVNFRVDGTVAQTIDDVTVNPGESVGGTFLYDSVSYELGDTVTYSVELVEFGNSTGGETSVGMFNQTGSVTIQGPVETDSTSVLVEIPSLDVIDDTGWLTVENLDNNGQTRTTPVEEGDSTLISLADIGGVRVNDTIEARLAPSDAFDRVLDTAATTVEAGDNKPIVSFTSNPPVPEVGQPVAFDAGNARGEGGSIVEYRWDFTNDGEFDAVSEDSGEQHTFQAAGTQEVRLVVENEVGLTAETVRGIIVEEEPAPPASVLSSLNIDAQGANATIEPGAANVRVTVANVGDESGAFGVTLAIGDAVNESQTTTTLGGGEDQRLLFDEVTAGLEPGAYDLTVSTDNDSITGTLTVETPPDPDPEPEPEFSVSIVETGDRPTAGENLTVTVAVENTGDGDGTTTVELDAGGLGSDTASLSLDSGESADVTFTLTPGADQTGEYDLTVSAGDAESSGAVTVEESTGGGTDEDMGGDGNGGTDEDAGGDGGTDDDGDGSAFTPLLVFLFLLVVLLFAGAYYYYVYEEDQSDDTMEPL